MFISIYIGGRVRSETDLLHTLIPFPEKYESWPLRNCSQNSRPFGILNLVQLPRQNRRIAE